MIAFYLCRSQASHGGFGSIYDRKLQNPEMAYIGNGFYSVGMNKKSKRTIEEFDSMHNGAYYPGLSSNMACTNKDEKNDMVGIVKTSSNRRKRRKELARLSRTSAQIHDTEMAECGAEDTNTDMMDKRFCNLSSLTGVGESLPEENILGSLPLNVRISNVLLLFICFLLKIIL